MTSLFYKRQTNAETLVGFRGLIFRASAAQSLENQVKNNSFFTTAAAVLEFAI